MRDVVDRAPAAERIPDLCYCTIDEAAFGVRGRGAWPRHLADDRLDHRKAVEPVILVLMRPCIVDHRERVERESRGERELDKAAALKFDRVLETPAVIDHHDLGASAAQRGA